MENDDLEAFREHARLTRRAAGGLAAGVLLGLVNAAYLARKMGTVTESPAPFVYALYSVAAALAAFGVRSWMLSRRARARIVAR